MLHRMKRFWSEERSLTALLGLLVINMFVLDPIIRQGSAAAWIKTIFFSLLLLAGLLTATRHRPLLVFMSLFVALAMISRWTQTALGAEGLTSWSALFSLLSVLAFTGAVLTQVNRQGPVTGHRVRGAVAGYLLIGLSCACAYVLIAHLVPGAFQMQSGDLLSREAQFDAFSYFSIVTLTTLGYGDITALHPVARSVVMVEALVGQLYPAILIARLVTLEMETRKRGLKQ